MCSAEGDANLKREEAMLYSEVSPSVLDHKFIAY